MDERQYFLSFVYHHEYNLQPQTRAANANSNSNTKDCVHVAKALRTLLATQVVSMDRVVMACSILLWPYSHSDNSYQLDLSSVVGLATLIDTTDPELRMTGALASEISFIVAILGFYALQVSKDLAHKFVHWLDSSLVHNTQFKATVLGMLLAPHHPLPPPPLRPVTSLDDLLAPALDPLLTLASQVVRTKPVPSLLVALASRYFDKTIPTLLPDLLQHANTRDPTLHALFGIPASSPPSASSSSPTLPLSRETLTRLEDLALTSLGAAQAAESLAPFHLDPGTSKTLRIVPFATLPTPAVLGWMHLLTHLVAASQADAPSASSTTTLLRRNNPHAQQKPETPPRTWHIADLGAVLTLVLRRAKKLAPLVRSVLDAATPRTHDWWLALHLDFWSGLVAARAVADWADVLARALETGMHPPSLRAVAKLLAPVGPLWTLRNKYAATASNASELVLDALDRVLVALLGHVPETALLEDAETGAELRDGVEHIVTHFKQWISGARETKSGGAPALVAYCLRLVKCVVHASRSSPHVCAGLAARMVSVLLEAYRDAESEVAAIGVFSLVPHLLTTRMQWSGPEAVTMLVDVGAETFFPAKWRVLALEALADDNANTLLQLVTVEQLESLVERVMASCSASSVRVALARVMDALPSATLASCKERTHELLLLFATGESDDHDQATLSTASAQVLSALSRCTLHHALPPIEPTILTAFKRSVMSSPHTGMFRQHHFTLVLGDAATAASGTPPPALGVADMRAVFQATASFPLPTALVHSRAALEFYLAWETARYCMLTRFKTPMGAPPATLAGIEVLVHRKHALALQTVNALDRWFASVKSGSQADAAAAGTPATASTIPALPKNMHAFFLSNDAVMSEWTTRMRRAAARSAVAALASPADAVRHVLELMRVDGPRGAHAAKADLPALAAQAVQLGWDDVVRGVASVSGRGLRAEWALARGEVEKVRKISNVTALTEGNAKTVARAVESVAASYLMVGEYKEVAKFVDSVVVTAHVGEAVEGMCLSALRELSESSSNPPSVAKLGVSHPLPPVAYIRSQFVESMPIHALDTTTSAMVPPDSPLHVSHHALFNTFHLNAVPTNTLAARLCAVHRHLGNLATAQACLEATSSTHALVQQQQLKTHARTLGRVSLSLALAHPSTVASLVRRGLVACDREMDQVRRELVVKSQQQTAHTMLALMGLEPTDDASDGAEHDLVSRLEAVSLTCDAHAGGPSADVADMVHSLLTAAVRVDPNEASAWRQLGNHYAESLPEPSYFSSSSSSSLAALDTTGMDQAVELAVCCFARYLELAVPTDRHRANVAALRLMHLIEHHADTLSASSTLSDTHLVRVTDANASTWTFLMPQLVAMLMHPHPFPAGFATHIVMQLAKHSPSACVYPLVALDLERPDLHVAARVLEAIQAPGMVETTRVLVEHAQRLTVLWDEQWHHSLTSLQGSVLRRAVTVPDMIRSLEQLRESHLLFPVSAHEQAFQAAFKGKIDAAVDGVKAQWSKLSASGSGAELDELTPEKWRGVVKALWKPLHPLVSALTNVVNRGRSLDLEQVEVLYGMDFSAGCLPGAPTRIARIASNFLVLPTKTKPKKITFVAEDGSAHAYLLKGLEDLRLDERMVQVFDTVNHMLTDAAARGGNRDASALLSLAGPSSNHNVVRGYAVVPLGRMGGFIQWVNAIPLYSIFKRQYMTLHGNQVPPKPLAAFNAAAHQVLGLAGSVPVSSLRKHCNDDHLLAIFKSLCAAERSDGLRNTLYLASTSSWSAIQTQRRFAHSVAATSMVGQVLGLGDRHLDNVLLDVANGQVVHIDYNVSFDRGAALRIPELVPFRLTRSFVDAMGGDVGVRGPFTAAAEVVLGLLRKHRKYIVQLLESMVMDEHANWDVVAGLGSGAAPAADDDGDANANEGDDDDDDEDDDDDQAHATDASTSRPVSQDLDDNGDQGLNPPSSDGVGSGSSVDPAAVRQRKVTGSESSLLDDEKREQAIRVLRNVMSKLEGGGVAASVPQQVTQLIDAATDEARLSRMFEGWTPWL